MNTKAVFLDSDGVLNVAPIRNGKPAAPTTVDELIIPTEVKPALHQLKQAGFTLICVTNKPDVKRGLMTQAALDAIYNKIAQELPLDEICICYDEDSPNFKPKPGMLLDAAKKYQIDLNKSFMIGDRWRDIEAGQNAGCRTVWINRNYAEQKPDDPSYTVSSLQQAVDWILAQI